MRKPVGIFFVCMYPSRADGCLWSLDTRELYAWLVSQLAQLVQISPISTERGNRGPISCFADYLFVDSGDCADACMSTLASDARPRMQIFQKTPCLFSNLHTSLLNQFPCPNPRRRSYGASWWDCGNWGRLRQLGSERESGWDGGSVWAFWWPGLEAGIGRKQFS